VRSVALLGGLVALAGSADAQSRRDRDDGRVRPDTTFAFAAGGTVDLQLFTGSVRVIGNARAEVRVAGTVEDGRLDVAGSARRITLTARARYGTAGEADLTVTVPHGTRVFANGVDLEFASEDTRGALEVNTVNGDIEVIGARDRVHLQTVSGEIEARRLAGEVVVAAVSGDVRIDEVQGRVEARSVSGDIEIVRGDLTEFRATSTSGDISYEGAVAATGRWELATHSGDVRLRVPSNLRADLVVETWSGDFESLDFRLLLRPGDSRAPSGSRNRRLEFGVGGGGGARVLVKSFSGDIRLESLGARAPREE
jgi:DUF4097 and DUF4098 domain-containing protein YvlB